MIKKVEGDTRSNQWTYVGEWRKDNKEGQGTYLWHDGSEYVGE